MKIQKIEVIQIETPRFYGYISGHVLVKIHVDGDAPIGWGEASDSRSDDVPALAQALNEHLVGRDARQIVELREFMQSRSWPSSVSEEYWHIGATHTRLGISSPLMVIGENSLLMVLLALYSIIPTGRWGLSAKNPQQPLRHFIEPGSEKRNYSDRSDSV